MMKWAIFATAGMLAVGSLGAKPVPVYTHGEAGYPCIRTPSLVQTASGTLLAFAGSRCGKGDGCEPVVPFKQLSHQDAVLKRSSDGGATWSAISVLNVTDCTNRNHGSAVWDGRTNATIFVYNAGGLHWMRSIDDGTSWSAARPIDLGNHSVARVAPGRGIQLRSTNPAAPGRILFVAQLETNSGDVIFFTDDGGQSWSESDAVIPGCNEAQIAELPNGTLLFNARDETSVPKGGRKFALSHDGGKTWVVLRALVHSFGGDNCMGSMAMPLANGPVYFSHPFNGGVRANGTIFVSGGGDSITFGPYAGVEDGAGNGFAYSCMHELAADSSLGLLFETGDAECTPQSASCRIMYTTVAA
mmetsp:Transcript_17451/g.45598  ORF Transcript_17451/g.45598 Transcript_17451/m.45598 type:complete len:358 (+) Transcript_17451:246-1319(+)